MAKKKKPEKANGNASATRTLRGAELEAYKKYLLEQEAYEKYLLEKKQAETRKVEAEKRRVLREKHKATRPNETDLVAQSRYDQATPLTFCTVWSEEEGLERAIALAQVPIVVRKGKRKGETVGHELDVLTESGTLRAVLPADIAGVEKTKVKFTHKK